MLEMILFLANN